MSYRSDSQRHRSRVPVPVVPVLWAGRLAARSVSRRRERADMVRRDAWLVDAVREHVSAAATDTTPDPVSVALTGVADTGVSAVSVEADDTPVSVPLQRRVRSVLWRRRRDTVTPVVTAVSLSVGWAVTHAVDGWLSFPGALVLLVPSAVGFGGAVWAAQVDVRRVSPLSRYAARLTVTVSFLWVLSPVKVRLGGVELELLPLLGDVIDYPWWVRWVLLVGWTGVAALARWRRFRPRPVEPVAPPTPVDTWNSTLAVEHKACAGMPMDPRSLEEVTSPETGEVIGWRAAVVCPSGTRGAPAVAAAVDNIATTYHVEPTQVEILGSHSRPVVQVIERTPFIDVSRPWQPGGYDLATGAIDLGTYPDGSVTRGRLWTPGQGVLHSWVTGGTGSGKSGVLNSVIGRAMETGVCVLDLADLGENSLPAWTDVAFRHGTTVDSAYAALLRGNALIDSRRRQAKNLRWVDRDGIEHLGRSTLEVPVPGAPDHALWSVYMIVVDEWPELLTNPDAMKLADRIGRLGRKFLVMLVLASQGASLKDVFKGCDVLRQNVQQGNIIGLRADKEAGGMVFAGAMKADLSKIPKGHAGLGYAATPLASRSTRFRGYWIDERDTRPEGVPSPWTVASYARPAQLGPGDAEAIASAEEMAAGAQRGTVTQLSARRGATSPSGEVDLKAAICEVMPRLCEKDGETSLMAVAAATAQRLGIPEEDKTRHYDRVRKALDALGGDAESRIEKAGRAMWRWRAA